MAAIRRHWHAIVCFHALILLAVGGWLYYVGNKPVRGQNNAPPPPAALIADDPAVYTRLMALRRELALTDRDLAALGQNADGAAAVLGTLVTWLQNNRDALQSANAAVLLAKRSLQDASRQINVGPKDDGVIASMPTLQTNHEVALTARQQVLAGAVTAINAHLSGDQQTLWAAARANAQLPDNVRYVTTLSAEQIQLLKQPASQAGISQILSADQQAQVAAAQASVNANLSAIADRTALLLPVPTMMRSVAATGPSLPIAIPSSQPNP